MLGGWLESGQKLDIDYAREHYERITAELSPEFNLTEEERRGLLGVIRG
jgi:hypothetical protein